MVHLIDNVLIFRPKDDADIKLVVPTALRKQIFVACHSGPLAAHLGSFRITQELRTEYFWPGLRRDIENWCKQCPICAKGRGPPPRRHGQLQKVFTGAPLDIVAIDILSGLPTTKDGNKYILVLTDYFTKWSAAYPLPDAEASTCTITFALALVCLDNFIRIWVPILNQAYLKSFVSLWGPISPTRARTTQFRMDNQNVLTVHCFKCYELRLRIIQKLGQSDYPL